ncbi:Extradiol ring-cleavage dioxygenase, class III enzyme, subunit B [Cordyceps fumosorosea ARSEF 2679]|uniref:Extradiol ring-cleavage dioxygenase, class III enzyme, subunit B n=1 Tax=Cordyceps fumosorosea (strain ARSEF 2679) TaxID=1081104 RepID=A0A168ESL8_CORFA|nr:Extradiol ring-cleavage dioxygenase, class III enzyme, subunit B [Cordyceps fumosorosea ARSEF 2679]OAA74161.1 Extradiol ring-cleavage dioxygenase, class III enzyme, subunit B [Cordyceps fumosorosea ARSEF 2679]
MDLLWIALALLIPFALHLFRAAAPKMPVGPVIALSHGGGPMPLLNDPGHKSIIASLRNRVPEILRLSSPAHRPRAIILVTAHWTTPDPVISAGASPQLLYDYYGFPPESYSITYPAPGAPDLAARVAAAMSAQGLSPTLDTRRGWDHGVFVPLALALPAADIPIVQVSVLADEDPARHLAMGRALAALREDNVAVVGSGFASFHNLGIMRGLRGFSGGSVDPAWLAFRQKTEEWNEALTGAVGEANATEGVARWRELPHADMMHPPGGGEHFMPLLVCAGAARGEDGPSKAYKDEYMGVDIFTYYWGAPAVTT